MKMILVSSTLVFSLLFRNDLRPHYTTQNAYHTTIRASKTMSMVLLFTRSSRIFKVKVGSLQNSFPSQKKATPEF